MLHRSLCHFLQGPPHRLCFGSRFCLIFFWWFFFMFFCFVPVTRLLLSLFSEGKAWELSSFLSSSRDKVGVVGSAARGESPSAGGVGGVGATPPSAKRARNSLSR